jgi:hypothetical protein
VHEHPKSREVDEVAKDRQQITQLWFGEREDRAPDVALAAMLADEAAREILDEVMRLGPKDRRLLLGVARQIASPGGGG